MIYSLFIGRWQPFHAGHKALIQKVLDEGKSVCVAIRDTEISEKNPYTVVERMEMIEEALPPQVKIIVIPDIEEVVYGRDVGWGIREIRLDPETESISGTKLRAKLANCGKHKICLTDWCEGCCDCHMKYCMTGKCAACEAGTPKELSSAHMCLS